ncbi:hypothetical protein J4480_04985 [Candidatus Woesearchaeota archaeon]|nr:hypothetical protein [Candidatus Woesearchaeota archaeon]
MGNGGLEGALETSAMAVESPKSMGRSIFSSKTAQALGFAAALYMSGCATDGRRVPMTIGLPGGQTVTIPAPPRTSASLDDRISLEGTSVDPKHEEFVNHLKDVAVAKYKPTGKGQKALTELRKYVNIEERHIMNIREINEFLMPMGMFLVEFFKNGVINMDINEIQTKDKFEAYAGGEHIGTYDRVILGKTLFSTKTLPPPGVGGRYGIGSPKKYVIFLPYYLVPLNLADYASMHEVGHIKYNIDEEGADLFALSAGMSRKIKIENLSDIDNYLKNQTSLTYKLQDAIKRIIFYTGKMDKNDPTLVGRVNIQNGLTDLSRKINSIDSQYPSDPRKASDQQIQAMSKLLFDRFLMKNPIYRLSGY